MIENNRLNACIYVNKLLSLQRNKKTKVEQLINKNYENLQFYGKAMRYPHSSREQERSSEEAPGAR